MSCCGELFVAIVTILCYIVRVGAWECPEVIFRTFVDYRREILAICFDESLDKISITAYKCTCFVQYASGFSTKIF